MKETELTPFEAQIINNLRRITTPAAPRDVPRVVYRKLKELQHHRFTALAANGIHIVEAAMKYDLDAKWINALYSFLEEVWIQELMSEREKEEFFFGHEEDSCCVGPYIEVSLPEEAENEKHDITDALHQYGGLCHMLAMMRDRKESLGNAKQNQ